MIPPFLHRLLPSNRSHDSSDTSVQHPAPLDVLNDAVSQLQGSLFTNFYLFHKEEKSVIDVLLFLPNYALYFGEKITWKYIEVKDAKVERASKQNEKNALTHLNSTEEKIRAKLQDVLSFDHTDIERFFIFEHLSEEEFDSLDQSFHTLLPKDCLIFAGDDLQTIQGKLKGLTSYKEEPYSRLKVLGALNAHTLLLPTSSDLFGRFLSDRQTSFLTEPLQIPLTHLTGETGSGKTSLLVRKVFMELLHNPSTRIAIITPTLFSSELFRKELIDLVEFSIVEINFSYLTFLQPDVTNPHILPMNLIDLYDMLVLDDYVPSNLDDLINACATKQSSILLSTYSKQPIENTFHLDHSYRTSHIKTIHFTHTKGGVYSVLENLKGYFDSKCNTPVVIILPTQEEVIHYKKAIDEHLQLESHLFSVSFSLQYQNLDPITLTVPDYLYGLQCAHSFVVNIAESSPLYHLALSRASETTTIITEDI